MSKKRRKKHKVGIVTIREKQVELPDLDDCEHQGSLNQNAEPKHNQMSSLSDSEGSVGAEALGSFRD